MTDANNGLIKLVRSLGAKKHRDEQGLFVAEGTKCVRDTWDAFTCRYLVATRAWYERCGTAAHYPHLVLANNRQMEQMSQFNTPSDVLAVYEIPHRQPDATVVGRSLCLMLDNVQDPGNLGTIVRLADWYGLTDIFAGKGTVDVYNHKVVQATMGAIARVAVHYGDLESVLDTYPDMPVYGTFLDGENIYRTALEARGFVVLGNEGQGISPRIAERVGCRLTIPAAPRSGGQRSESLNVGVAAAVVISEFMRGKL